jgi:RNA polymerase primary sigma factor
MTTTLDMSAVMRGEPLAPHQTPSQERQVPRESRIESRADSKVLENRVSEEPHSYLHRLTRGSLLNHKEEIRLAKEIALGGSTGHAAKMRIVECNMRLVVSIAKAYRNCGIPLEDLVQEGAIGLMTAADRYDHTRGYRFSTYATQWIRQAIGRAVDNKSKSIRIPAHVSESLRKMEKIRESLRRELGTEPSNDQLATACEFPLRKVLALQRTIQDPLSLEMPVGDEDSTTLGALLRDDDAADPQESILRTERKEQIQHLLDLLDSREQTIMRYRYGLDGDGAHPLQQIGETLNLSRERVRQIEAQAMRKLRQHMRNPQLKEMLS